MSEPFTLLFVDDEPQIRATVRRMLSGSNLNVLTAESGRAALEVLRSRPVDVLVSDVDMPEMSGLELVRIVRREYPAVLRMMLTGVATLELALAEINSGEVSRFFTKPFDATLFRETIAALAERVERNRSTQIAQAREARRRQLDQWVDEAFPDAARGLEYTGDEPIEIDLGPILRELEPSDPDLIGLLGSLERMAAS